MHYTQDDTYIILILPLKDVIGNGIYIAVAISAIIGLGIVLLQIHIFRHLLQENVASVLDVVSRKWVRRRPGIIIVLVLSIIFSTMLLLLEDRTNVTLTAMMKRVTIQHEIGLRKGQENTISRTFIDFYCARSHMLAAFLTEHANYQTFAGLQERKRIAKTDYLMLFDSTETELIASNSYTDFSSVQTSVMNILLCWLSLCCRRICS